MEHKLVEKYKLFIKAIDSNPYDFMIGEKKIDFPLISESFIENFKTIGTTKAGCIIGEYTGKKKYIVWLDSEGEPNFPIAETANDFFSILPWTTGYIYDMGFKLLMNAEVTRGIEVDHLFLDDYVKNIGIKRHPQPELIIKNAIKKYKKDLDSVINK